MHDDLLERLPRHVLHHDEEHTVLLLRREDGDDVWMVHRGEKARFLQHLGKIQVLLVRDLECDLLVDPLVFGKEHAAEAAAAERRKDSILPYGLALEKHEDWQEYNSVNARFYAPDAHAPGDVVTLPQDEGEHLTRVLRLKDRK